MLWFIIGFIIGSYLTYKLICYILGYTITNHPKNIARFFNLTPEQSKNLNKVIKTSKFNQENKFRERQEIIKRNTATNSICGLSKDGECLYIGYCKYQRKFKKYGSTDEDILCMREGKGENK